MHTYCVWLRLWVLISFISPPEVKKGVQLDIKNAQMNSIINSHPELVQFA